jgi:hypothetical protein
MCSRVIVLDGAKLAAVSRPPKATRASPAESSAGGGGLDGFARQLPQAARDDALELFRRERFEHHYPATRQQGANDFERRVLGGGANENDGAAFDVRQEGVLLGLVEAVNFVHEEQGGPTGALALGGAFDYLFDLGQAARDGRDFLKSRPGAAGNDAGEGGFAGAGRPPQNQRSGGALLDHGAQKLALPHYLGLAHIILEGARAHAVSQGAAGVVRE